MRRDGTTAISLYSVVHVWLVCDDHESSHLNVEYDTPSCVKLYTHGDWGCPQIRPQLLMGIKSRVISQGLDEHKGSQYTGYYLLSRTAAQSQQTALG